jgi:hypothetical protein
VAYLYQKKTRRADKRGETEQVLVLLGDETSVEMAQYLGSALCPEPLIWWYDEANGYYEGASKWNKDHAGSPYHYVVSDFDLTTWTLCRLKVVKE